MALDKFLILTNCVLILTICVLVNSKKGNTVTLKNLECKVNYTWIAENMTCKIKAHSRTKYTAEMYGFALKPLRQINYTSCIQLHKRFNDWKPWVLKDMNESLCNLLDGKNFNPIYNIFKPTIAKYTNLNHSCPYSGEIFAKNLNLDILDFGASIVPTGYYRLSVFVYEQKQRFIALLKFYAEIIELY